MPDDDVVYSSVLRTFAAEYEMICQKRYDEEYISHQLAGKLRKLLKKHGGRTS